MIEGSRFAIQGRELRTGLDIVPLGVYTSIVVDVTLNISIDELQGNLNSENVEILLEDKTLNITHNLKTSSYSFELNGAGYYDDRFNLIIKESGVLHVGSSEFDANLILEREGSIITFKTKNNSMIARFKVSDFLGRTLIDTTPKKNYYTLKSHNYQVGSVLLINIELDNNESFSKKIMLLK